MKVITTDINILSELREKGFCSQLCDAKLEIHAMLSALPVSLHSEAKSLAENGVLTLVELDDDSNETLWLSENLIPAISMNELYIIRYAMNNNMIVLSNDRTFRHVAEKFGVKVIVPTSIFLPQSFFDDYEITFFTRLGRFAIQ